MTTPGTVASPARASRRGRVALLATALLAAALAAVAGFEAVRYSHEHSRLNTARTELAHVRASLSATTAKLAKTKRLSQRQAAILAQTALVLKKVDPLLSDADQLQQITGSIQTARDTFASDSAQMTSDLLALENYEANPQNYPGVDQWGLVAQVNSELQTVRADFASLTSYDGSFSAASTTFGHHADGFTAAVRQLQKQLQQLGAAK